MPNIDNANQFLILEGNTAGTNGIIQVIGNNTVLDIGNNSISNTQLGYFTLTNGFIFQYGSVLANSTGTVVTLPYVYQSNVYVFSAESNNIVSALAIHTANTTKISIFANTTANVLASWFTIGI